MKLYLAGPMTGLPDHNIPAFQRAARELRARGFQVVSPAETEGGEDQVDQADRTWEEWMRRDIKLLVDCDGIACLPGWEGSRGATLETDIAIALGMPLICAGTIELIGEGRRGCGLGRQSLDATLAEAVRWAAQTFPRQTIRSKALHLKREAGELADAPEDAEEMADVLILLAGLADMVGVNLDTAVRGKLEVLRSREWGEPDADGVVEHVRELEVIHD